MARCHSGPDTPHRRNRTGANGNIANHCGGELVRGVGGSLSPGTVQLGTVHLRVRFRYFSLFRVLTSHSTMATLQLLRIESAPLPFTAPWPALPPWPCRFPSRFAFRRQCEILKRLCGRACSPATAPAPRAPCASSSEHHRLQTGNLVGFQSSERRGCLQHLRG